MATFKKLRSYERLLADFLRNFTVLAHIANKKDVSKKVLPGRKPYRNREAYKGYKKFYDRLSRLNKGVETFLASYQEETPLGKEIDRSLKKIRNKIIKPARWSILDEDWAISDAFWETGLDFKFGCTLSALHIEVVLSDDLKEKEKAYKEYRRFCKSAYNNIRQAKDFLEEREI